MKNTKLSKVNSPLDQIPRGSFIKQYGINACREKYSDLNSYSKALDCDSPLLSHISKSYGRQSAIAYIETWLYNLNDFLNISRRLKKEQMYETALYIIQDYYYLSIAEIHLFFKKIKKGEFGNLYEGIDGYKILYFLNMFDEERLSIIESKRKKTKEDSPSIKSRAGFLFQNIDKMPSLRKMLKNYNQNIK
jgi:hypothetical protein